MNSSEISVCVNRVKHYINCSPNYLSVYSDIQSNSEEIATRVLTREEGLIPNNLFGKIETLSYLVGQEVFSQHDQSGYDPAGLTVDHIQGKRKGQHGCKLLFMEHIEAMYDLVRTLDEVGEIQLDKFAIDILVTPMNPHPIGRIKIDSDVIYFDYAHPKRNRAIVEYNRFWPDGYNFLHINSENGLDNREIVELLDLVKSCEILNEDDDEHRSIQNKAKIETRIRALCGDLIDNSSTRYNPELYSYLRQVLE